MITRISSEQRDSVMWMLSWYSSTEYISGANPAGDVLGMINCVCGGGGFEYLVALLFEFNKSLNDTPYTS